MTSYSLLSKEGNLKFSSFDPIKGEVSKSGKSYPIITTNSGSGEALVKENDGLYVYKYSITPDFSGNYSISESKFKADSNNFKYLIYVGSKSLGTQENISRNHDELKNTMNELSDLFINLCASIKARYFEYGIITASVIENTRFE